MKTKNNEDSNSNTTLTPDAIIVEETLNAIDALLTEKNPRILNAIAALVGIIILKCQVAEISKTTIVAYFNNAWELNDPENDHPLKKEMPSFKC